VYVSYLNDTIQRLVELPVPSWAESAGLGGADFSAVQSMPLAAGRSRQKHIMPDAPASNSTPLAGKRILVVDDEFLIVLDIQSVLEAAGATVVTASRINDALKAIADAEQSGDIFNACVLDLKLDKDSSAPVADKLAAASVPFVFLTGAPTDVSLAKIHGSAPVVGKPFDSAALLAALQQAMSGRH
jgi:CheY-like chemotaxis protein